MKIKLITVGKLKEKYLKDGIAEYIKRLGRFAKVEQVELVDEISVGGTNLSCFHDSTGESLP